MKKILLLVCFVILFTPEIHSQLVQSNFTGVMSPQYICSGSASRLPYVYRATVSGLIPNAKYRYYSQACLSSDYGGSNSGAGNPLYIHGDTYWFSSSTNLSTAGNYDSIFTDANGSYTGWFGFVHSGNARFTAGNYIHPTITLDSAGNGNVTYRYALNDSMLVLEFSTTAGANSATGLYGISLSNPKNIISVYDNVNNTGRPLAMTFVESDGTQIPSLVQYYVDSVDSRNGRWGTMIPNSLSTGVRRVNVHHLTNGSIANFQTDADGIWPSGTNTVNPTGGATSPLRLTQSDVPLVVKNSNLNPGDFSLEQNYPNPFNPSTIIKFGIAENSFVSLKVFDQLGREITTLVDEELTQGSYSVKFNGDALSNGIYFYTMKTGEYSQTKKMILTK